MLKERSAVHKVNQESYALAIKELLEHPCTAYELTDVTGLHIKTVQDLMRVFARHKVVHIAGWEPNGRGIDTTPVWKLGKGRNVARRRKTRAQVSADYRERKAMREMVNLTPAAPPVKDVPPSIDMTIKGFQL